MSTTDSAREVYDRYFHWKKRSWQNYRWRSIIRWILFARCPQCGSNRKIHCCKMDCSFGQRWE